MPILNDIGKKVFESYVWKSMFRHGYADTSRNRVLQVANNVWLHLHPAKIRRHALRVRFTWCMGGITFLMFLVTVVTGVALMFYYRPVGEFAYADLKYLEFDAPFGMLMRNMHRWAAHGMVIFRLATHVSGLHDGVLTNLPGSLTGSLGFCFSPSPCS